MGPEHHRHRTRTRSHGTLSTHLAVAPSPGGCDRPAAPDQRGLPDWEATIIAAEQVCDAVTAQGLAGTGDATGDDAPESA
ncbi:MAG: hypothetical protein JF597_06030 [Streptomyces sp.]|uniref:hypothetical protein n=1 Tax=Streptomyces sp. TaxID=1931 RepID=UPI0025E26B96|nr:hypothetical protein [Streptomyces sp.]MBW8793148.1 hypothetical protein [Streptomyces sp.]